MLAPSAADANGKRVIPGTPVFDGEAASHGYALNAMCYSFNSADNRARFVADEEAYMDSFRLSDAQRDAVRARNVLAMLDAGGNVYYLAKLAGIFGLNVQDLGSLQTGKSVEEFKAALMEHAITEKERSMSEVIGGLFTSHVPAIGNAIARKLQDNPYWKPFFDGFDPVHAFLEREKPDVAVVFYNDHGLNFFLDKMPTFAIGAAPEYRHEDEGWGIAFDRPISGHVDLSWHIIEEMVASEFDPVTCQSMLIDHAVAVPFELLWPGRDAFPVKLIPIAINTVQHPLPSPRRCFELGRTVGRALATWRGDEKIIVLGTGGLSHQLEGGRAGHINVDYDKFCLRNLSRDPEALLQHSSLDIVELAGSQGVEILNWIAARGALTGSVRELASNYHVPISNTAAATVLLENSAVVHA